MRKKHNLNERINRNAHLLIETPRAHKGKWRELTDGRPLHLEIGCGKGRFAVTTALENSDIFIVAVEVEPNALVVALELAAKSGVKNVRFMNIDAAELGLYFAPRELARIYLNFSDPWPKTGYRRLTHERFIRAYHRLLADDGSLWMKTDNSKLFEWSLEQFSSLGWRLDEVSRDVHGEREHQGVHYNSGEITEYEQRFIDLGTPINRLVAYPPDGARDIAVELRDVRTEDEITELCSLARRLWREHYTPIIGKQQVAYMLEKFQSECAVAGQIANGYVYKLLVADGESAGYMAAKRENDRLFLSKLYIDRRYRGHGFARLMFNECERLADGLGSIYLTCNKHNTAAHEVYKRLGFKVIDSVVTDIGEGFVMDDYIFERSVGSPTK